MPDADPPRPDDAPRFRSPKRALARSFRLSRDRWKLKATQRRQEIRALRVRLRDLQASRHLWKQKALDLQRQLEQLLGLDPEPQDGGPDTAALDPPPPDDAATPRARAGGPEPAAPPAPTDPGPVRPLPAAADGASKKKRRTRP